MQEDFQIQQLVEFVADLTDEELILPAEITSEQERQRIAEQIYHEQERINEELILAAELTKEQERKRITEQTRISED